MLTAVKIFVALGLLAFLAIHSFFYLNQRQLMYFPSTQNIHPQQIGLDDVDEVSLLTGSNVTLVSWYGQARPGSRTILFFHGNGGAISDRDHRIRGLMQQGLGVFVLGYPGYGGNAGTPSEASFLEAALLAYEYLRETGLAASDIVIYGESIGSGVAVQLAAQVDAGGMILQSPMSSVADVARVHYPFLLAGPLLKDSYKSIEHIERIGMPLLVMHGDRDEIVPIEFGKKLFAIAKDPKQFVALAGAHHNDLHEFSIDEIVTEFARSLQGIEKL